MVLADSAATAGPCSPSADASGTAACSGFILHAEWAHQLVSGLKTWELRKKKTNKRGTVAVLLPAAGGMHQVVGVVTIVDCRQRAWGELIANTTKHRVDDIARLQQYCSTGGSCYVWEVTGGQACVTPLYVPTKAGRQVWATLNFGMGTIMDAVQPPAVGHLALNERMLLGPVAREWVPLCTCGRWKAKCQVAPPPPPPAAPPPPAPPPPRSPCHQNGSGGDPGPGVCEVAHGQPDQKDSICNISPVQSPVQEEPTAGPALVATSPSEHRNGGLSEVAIYFL